MIYYAAVLHANYPDAEWTIFGNTYDGLTWLSDTPKPTQKELDAAWAQVQHDLQVKQVEAARLAAYERESDPIFFKWQRGSATEQDWLDAVAAVKAKFPYPDGEVS
jgi:hypothetical protein